MECPHCHWQVYFIVVKDVKFPACCYSVEYVRKVGFHAALASLTPTPDAFEAQLV